MHHLSPSKGLNVSHRNAMAEEILYRQCIHHRDLTINFIGNMFDVALKDIRDKVILIGGKDLTEYVYGQPQPLEVICLHGYIGVKFIMIKKSNVHMSNAMRYY